MWTTSGSLSVILCSLKDLLRSAGGVACTFECVDGPSAKLDLFERFRLAGLAWRFGLCSPTSDNSDELGSDEESEASRLFESVASDEGAKGVLHHSNHQPMSDGQVAENIYRPANGLAIFCWDLSFLEGRSFADIFWILVGNTGDGGGRNIQRVIEYEILLWIPFSRFKRGCAFRVQARSPCIALDRFNRLMKRLQIVR